MARARVGFEGRDDAERVLKATRYVEELQKRGPQDRPHRPGTASPVQVRITGSKVGSYYPGTFVWLDPEDNAAVNDQSDHYEPIHVQCQIFFLNGATPPASSIGDPEYIFQGVPIGPDPATGKFVVAVYLPSATESSGGECSASGLAWVLGKSVLIFENPDADPPILAKMFALALRNGTGQCACLEDQGDTALGRYLDGQTEEEAFEPQEGDTYARAKWNVDADGKWVGLFAFIGCCGGCFKLKIEIDLTKETLPGKIIGTATVTGTKCDSEASSSFTLVAGCGERSGVAVLHAFSEAVCEWPPTDPECDNAFDLYIKCVPCNLPNVGCAACLERVAAPVYEATRSGVKKYLAAGEDCTCLWTEGCDGDTLTFSGSKAIYTASDGNIYEYDTNTESPECDIPPSCWQELTLPWVSGPAGTGSVTIRPVACKPIDPPTDSLCIDGSPDFYTQVDTAFGSQDAMMIKNPGEADYYAGPFVFSQWTGCNPLGEGYSMGMHCGLGSCGIWEITVSGLGAPTGTTISFSFVVHSIRPLYATFEGVLECCVLCDFSPGDKVQLPYTGFISEIGASPPYWCNGTTCLGPSRTAPEEGAKPYRTLDECQKACGCEPGVEALGARVSVAGARPLPGTELKKLLKSIGITAEGCGCDGRAAEMDRRGVEWCREHREEIAGWLREQSGRRGWKVLLSAAAGALFSGLAFRLNPLDYYGSIVDEAIRRAEVSGNPGDSNR